MMAFLRNAFFYNPEPNQIWESRIGLPPIKVVRVTPDCILVVKANVAFSNCWEPEQIATRYAEDLRQWRDRLSEEKRRLRK